VIHFPRRTALLAGGAVVLAAGCLLTAVVVAPVQAAEAHRTVSTTVLHTAQLRGEAGVSGEAGVRGASQVRGESQIREASGVRDQIATGHIGTVTPDADAVPYAYAGDSITARPDSWLHVLADDPHLDAIGGYAHSGYRSDQVLAYIGPVPGAQVLVLELGTNDINQARDLARTVADIDAVAAKVGAPHVLLVAAPPSDHTTSLWGADRQRGSVVLNGLLRADATRHGWTFDDPFAADRESDNAWRAGSSADGIHPTAAASRVIARAFAADIAAAAGSRG
jgi:hypothetical protein